MTEQEIQAVKAIIDLYKTPTGGVGGYGHVVFDDRNTEPGFVEQCLDDAIKGNMEWICEETRQASIKALTLCLGLSTRKLSKVVHKAFYKKHIYQ